MNDMNDSTDTRTDYLDFAQAATASSPAYEAWSRAVVAAADVLARIVTLPERERQPNLVFAAARWLGADPADPNAIVRTLRERWDDVRAITAVRATQTNEIGRCGVLVPLLARIEGPIALLEVGASAGLCLLADHYAYRWATPDGVVRSLDPEVSTVQAPVIRTTVRGGPVPTPARMPAIVWRAGYDLAPVDVSDDDAAAWLENLVWPGEVERAARLRAAIDVARLDPPRVVRGDLRGDLDDLRALAAEAPDDATLVVVHSAVLVYLRPLERPRVASALDSLGGCWIANEAPGVVPGTEGAASGDAAFVVSVDGVPVGRAHGHGTWVEWPADR